MGDGAGDPNRSGSIILGRGKTGGDFTLDAGSFGGMVAIQSITAGGSVNTSFGNYDQGDYGVRSFSAGHVSTVGDFIYDAVLAQNVHISGVSAGNNVSIHTQGDGSGNIVIGNSNWYWNTYDGVTTGGTFSLTGNNSGDIQLANVTASGGININVAGSGSIHANALEAAALFSLKKQ